MPIVHAKDFGASSSERWLNCPSSVIEVRQYQKTTSTAAEEGTCAHELGELALVNDLNYEQLCSYEGEILSDAPSVKVDKEMIDYVWGYVEYCRSFIGDMFVEIQVDYSPWASGGFGTSDCIVIDDKRGAVIDLKYGKGIEVDAENNTQAMLYALGVYNEYDMLYDFPEDYVFELHIYQPRRNNFSVWEISLSDLLIFGEHVKAQVEKSKRDNPEYNPTEKGCLWCAHKVNCVALKEYTEKTIGGMFDDLSLPDPTKVNHSEVLQAKGLIESWLKAVEQHCFEKLLNGDEVEGFKLVEGRSNRGWCDEKTAMNEILFSDYTEEQLFTKKFLTVPQAEKLMGKVKFNDEYGDLVVKPEGKPTLVPVSDKRKPIGNVLDDFEQL